MLTVVCLWVTGHVPYSADYVARLRSMVARFVDEPHQFVCLTDRPDEVPDGVVPIYIEPIPGLKPWWNKVRLFDPKFLMSGRGVYLDLDVLIIKPLKPIIEYPAEFAIIPYAGNFNGSHGLSVVKKYNSSVMVWNAGAAAKIFTMWSRDSADRLWGDQDWIGEVMPSAATMPIKWFPRLSEARPPWPEETKVVLCKKPKNADAAKQFPWFDQAWR